MKIKNCTWARTGNAHLSTRIIWDIEIGKDKTFVYEEWRNWEDERVTDIMEYGITEVSDAVTDEEIDEYGRERLDDFIERQDCTEYPESRLEDIISFEELVWVEEHINNINE